MISLCIPTYNRTQMLFESFVQVLDDDRISEIVIVDDHSELKVWEELLMMATTSPKIKLYRNDKNVDCYRNKHEAVKLASNFYVILFDSDNVMTKIYLDALFDKIEYWRPETILQPSFAKPHFNFKKFGGRIFDKHNVRVEIGDSSFGTMLNAMNFCVNREEYLKVWDGSIDPVTSDSLYFNYKWLEAGNSIYVVPGLEYEHKIHEGSHYRNNVNRTPKGFHDSIIQKLKNMK